MKSQKPYMIQAIYNWIQDNGWTPYVLVKADYPGVEVPAEHVQDQRIVLNISMTAVQSLHLGLDWIEFSARFAGSPRRISFPTMAVLAIYARENNQGMGFEEPELPPTEPTPPASDSSDSGRKRPSLKVVK